MVDISMDDCSKHSVERVVYIFDANGRASTVYINALTPWRAFVMNKSYGEYAIHVSKNEDIGIAVIWLSLKARHKDLNLTICDSIDELKEMYSRHEQKSATTRFS